VVAPVTRSAVRRPPERPPLEDVGLASVVDGNDGTAEGVHVVVTLRADFFDRPLAHAALGPLVAAHPFAVTPMSAAELRDAVVSPAAALGVVFEPGLDSAIVSEVAHQPASLPLLQFTLAELFERRQGRVIARSTGPESAMQL
jgi:hypothetical protein